MYVCMCVCMYVCMCGNIEPTAGHFVLFSPLLSCSRILCIQLSFNLPDIQYIYWTMSCMTGCFHTTVYVHMHIIMYVCIYTMYVTINYLYVMYVCTCMYMYTVCTCTCGVLYIHNYIFVTGGYTFKLHSRKATYLLTAKTADEVNEWMVSLQYVRSCDFHVILM